MTPSQVADPMSNSTRDRLFRLRRKYAGGGIETLADHAARLSPTAARAALILAIATEGWTDAEKAALDPCPPPTEEIAA